ncbi:hypothetical protein [Nonomuraea sp. NPDC005501]|uniref:helix-turn-helix domain-containing protein n=1 Tax=Nonomuraea sp. NPDC005501 TaxID=3156884 RepID=UPI0033AE83FA
MNRESVRLGVGTRLVHDGEVLVVEEVVATPAGLEVLAKDGQGSWRRVSARILVTGAARVISPEPRTPEPGETVAARLSQLDPSEQAVLLERAAHLRELLTGYRSGSAELAAPGEPRPEYAAGVPLMQRYASKASELNVAVRTIRRWVRGFRKEGEAGLISIDTPGTVSGRRRVDPQWTETALEIMAEHVEESKPFRMMVIRRTAARLETRHGPGAIELPSRATAFRVLEELERRRPTFRLSTKRNRDIAERPRGTYGKRITSTAAQRIFPTPQFDLRELPDPSHQGKTPHGLLLIIIPPSGNAPHAVAKPGKEVRLAYPRRHLSNKIWLSESDVAAAYRRRFTAAADQQSRVAAVGRLLTLKSPSALPRG